MRQACRIACLSAAISLGLFISACSDPAIETDIEPATDPGAVRGILRSATADYFDENRSEKLYALQRKDGSLLSLQFSGRPPAPVGSEILVWGPQQADGLHVEKLNLVKDLLTRGGVGQQGSPVIDPMPLSPPIKGAFVSLSPTYTKAMLDARKLRDDFIKPVLEMSSYGRWTMEFDVFGPLTVPNDCGGAFYDNLGKNGVAAMQAAGIDTTQYQQIQFLIGSSVPACTWGGFGLDGHTPIRTDGVRGQYNPWSYVKNDGEGVMVQEIGHNWGLAHQHFCPNTQAPAPTGMPTCTGYVEYGSPFTPMASGNNVYLNAWERIQMNFFAGCNVLTVATSGTYDIGSMSLPCNGPQVLRIAADEGTDAQRYYYIEYRTPAGIDQTNGVLVGYSADILKGGWSRCDWGGPDCPEDWLINPVGATRQAALLPAGTQWTTPQGVGIRIVSLGETAKFELTFPTQGAAPTCLEGGPWDNQPPVCKGNTGVDGGPVPPPPSTDAGRDGSGGGTSADSGSTGGQAGTGGATGGSGGATGGTGGATTGAGGSGAPAETGCGCRVPGSGTPGGLSAFAAAAALGTAARLRRRPRTKVRS